MVNWLHQPSPHHLCKKEEKTLHKEGSQDVNNKFSHVRQLIEDEQTRKKKKKKKDQKKRKKHSSEKKKGKKSRRRSRVSSSTDSSVTQSSYESDTKTNRETGAKLYHGYETGKYHKTSLTDKQWCESQPRVLDDKSNITEETSLYKHSPNNKDITQAMEGKIDTQSHERPFLSTHRKKSCSRRNGTRSSSFSDDKHSRPRKHSQSRKHSRSRKYSRSRTSSKSRQRKQSRSTSSGSSSSSSSGNRSARRPKKRSRDRSRKLTRSSCSLRSISRSSGNSRKSSSDDESANRSKKRLREYSPSHKLP